MDDQLRYAALHLGQGAAPVLQPETIAYMQHATRRRGQHVRPHRHLLDARRQGADRIVKHGGATNGHLSSFELLPGRGFAVTVLTNTDSGREARQTVADACRHHFLGSEADLPAADRARGEGEAVRRLYRAVLATLRVAAGPEGASVVDESPERQFAERRLRPLPPNRPDRVLRAGPRGRARRLASRRMCEFLRDADGAIAWMRWDGRIARREPFINPTIARARRTRSSRHGRPAKRPARAEGRALGPAARLLQPEGGMFQSLPWLGELAGLAADWEPLLTVRPRRARGAVEADAVAARQREGERLDVRERPRHVDAEAAPAARPGYARQLAAIRCSQERSGHWLAKCIRRSGRADYPRPGGLRSRATLCLAARPGVERRAQRQQRRSDNHKEQRSLSPHAPSDAGKPEMVPAAAASAGPRSDGVFHAAQGVLAHIGKGEAFARYEVGGRRRRPAPSAARHGRDARGRDHAGAEQVAILRDRFAGIDADAHADAAKESRHRPREMAPLQGNRTLERPLETDGWP